MKKRLTVHQLKDKLWRLTSKLVRSQSEVCYTCNKYLEFRDRQAGHFWSKGGHQAARFHLDNLRVQCDQCNRWKSGNLAEYAIKLSAELGKQRFEDLFKLAHTTKTSWKREELEPMIVERTEQLKKYL